MCIEISKNDRSSVIEISDDSKQTLASSEVFDDSDRVLIAREGFDDSRQYLAYSEFVLQTN